MAGTSNYPGALDNFAEASPTNLGDEDSTGRTHSERHDDIEAAMEAVQEELGTDPSGASASTVAARFTALDSTVAGRVAASVVTTAGDLIVGAGSASVTRLGKGAQGYVLTSSSAGAQGLIWAEASGGATVEMSPTQPLNPDNGTLWVDTDSDVPTFTASAYALSANPTFTGVAQFPDGSASAPSITNTGDTNTGIFHPADDTVAISTGGTERVRVNSTGLGIGVSPSTDFDIVRDAQVSSRWRSAVTSNRGSLLYFDKARGSWASPSSVSNSDAVMELYARAHDGTQVRDVAAIVANIDSVPATNDLGARLSFQTRPSGVAASVTERMRIDSAGQVTGTGTSLGAWTAYTPTLGGTGWAIGDGTIVGYYCQIGKVAHFRVDIVFGATSTYGSVNPTVTMPVTMGGSFTRANSFACQLVDASLSATYLAGARQASTTTLTLQPLGASGLLGTMNTTTPFTWATSDGIRISGSYEAA